MLKKIIRKGLQLLKREIGRRRQNRKDFCRVVAQVQPS